MNNQPNFSSNNASTRRVYQRRNRKGNRSTTVTTAVPIALTSTIVSNQTSLLINSSAVPINDLFAPISYLTQYKYFFFIGLSLLILLCLTSIIFLVVLSRCSRIKTWRKNRLDEKHYRNKRDFLDVRPGNGEENSKLLESVTGPNMPIDGTITKNGTIATDNVSNTFSLDPMLEQKIAENNPPNAVSTSPQGDDISVDTLRGSLGSSPSQQMPSIQPLATPTHHHTPAAPAQPPAATKSTIDSIIHPDEHAVGAEKDDELDDFDFKQIRPRFTKVDPKTSGHRTSSSSIGQSILRKEKQDAEAERAFLHGSNSNIYEKEMRKLDAKRTRGPDDPDLDGTSNPKPGGSNSRTTSQVSLVSRTSEDSCY